MGEDPDDLDEQENLDGDRCDLNGDDGVLVGDEFGDVSGDVDLLSAWSSTLFNRTLAILDPVFTPGTFKPDSRKKNDDGCSRRNG